MFKLLEKKEKRRRKERKGKERLFIATITQVSITYLLEDVPQKKKS